MLHNLLVGSERDRKLWIIPSLPEVSPESEKCVESSNKELPSMSKTHFRQIPKTFAKGPLYKHLFKIQQTSQPLIAHNPKSKSEYECPKMAG